MESQKNTWTNHRKYSKYVTSSNRSISCYSYNEMHIYFRIFPCESLLTIILTVDEWKLGKVQVSTFYHSALIAIQAIKLLPYHPTSPWNWTRVSLWTSWTHQTDSFRTLKCVVFIYSVVVFYSMKVLENFTYFSRAGFGGFLWDWVLWVYLDTVILFINNKKKV